MNEEFGPKVAAVGLLIPPAFCQKPRILKVCMYMKKVHRFILVLHVVSHVVGGLCACSI